MIKSRITETRFSKEAALLQPVERFARVKGFSLQKVELPFYEYRIDLYGFSLKKDATVAIELKLNDWRRALEQAMLYQLCADLVYIAMPARATRRVDHAQLRSHGVGLIAVLETGRCSCVLQAAKHSEVRHYYRQSQIEYLQGEFGA
jgi:hypothetical protein